MAPKKTSVTKRAAGTAEDVKAPAAKKARADPMLSGILEAIDLAEGHLSSDCRAMLASMVPGAFGAPQEERHGYQQRAVAMVGEVVEGVRARLREAVEAEDAKVLAVRGSKAGLEGQVEAARAAAATAAAACDAQSNALAEVSSALLEKKSLLAASVEVQKSGDAPFTLMQAEKQQYEAVLVEEFKIVLEGISQTKKETDKIIALAKQLAGVDESLLSAAPSSCLKKADARSQFDNMVLETLAKSFADHVASLTTTLGGAKVGLAERAAAVQAAQVALDETKAKQQATATDTTVAQAARREAQASLADAEAVLSKFEPTLAAAEKLAGEHKAALQNFETWNICCFEMLRDKVKKPERVEEVALAAEASSPPAPAAEGAPVAEVAVVEETAPVILAAA